MLYRADENTEQIKESKTPEKNKTKQNTKNTRAAKQNVKKTNTIKVQQFGKVGFQKEIRRQDRAELF